MITKKLENIVIAVYFIIIVIAFSVLIFHFLIPISQHEWQIGLTLNNANASFWSTRDGTNYSEPEFDLTNKTLPENITVSELLDLLCRYSDVQLFECHGRDADRDRDIPDALPKMRSSEK